MIAKTFVPVAAGSAIALAFLSPATASMVTTADLSGKTICWDEGWKDTYAPGGKLHSTRYGEGTWSATANGVEILAQSWPGLKTIEKLPDGTFKFTATAAAGFRLETNGKLCR
jgi:hypothetical protein